MTELRESPEYLAPMNLPELRGIRILTLRKLVALWLTHPFAGPKQIQLLLRCCQRTAYDYYRALKIIRTNMPKTNRCI
jgi:hypothetical protein